MARNRTPVVTGTGKPLNVKVASATVNGLNGFEIGTLMPIELKGVPSEFLNGSGVNGTAAKEESKSDRTILKSANTTSYLSHMSRMNDP